MTIKKEYQENSLLLYQGPVTVNLVSFLGNYIRSFLNHETKALQRLFRIFIELTQNVSYYSAETRQVKNGIYCGTGWFSLQEFPDHYRFTTGNQVNIDHGPKLINYCNEINALNEDQLRKLKRDTRAQAMVRDVGAHIGLIQTSIISGNKLDYQIINESEKYSFFIISTKVDK